MVLVMVSIVDNTSFLIQMVVGIGVLIIVLNIWAFVLYCSTSGSPYKNESVERHANWVAYVAALWTVCTTGKLIAGWFNPELFSFEVEADDKLREAVILFTIIVLTEMFPIACVLEGKFVKIFTLEHLDITQVV